MSTNMYIKFEGTAASIVGDATDDVHKTGELEVFSWSHGFNQPTSSSRASTGGGTVERANHSDFSFTKIMDKATVNLLKTCWTGDMAATVTFSCYRADDTRVKYLEVIMNEVIISSISISGGAGDMPMENVSLNYGKVTYKYLPQKETDNTAGTAIESYHDLVTNKAG